MKKKQPDGWIHDHTYKGEPFIIISSLFNPATRLMHYRIKITRKNRTKEELVINSIGEIIP
jgi:hypothetical protein